MFVFGNTVQKKIGLMVSVIGLIALINNISERIMTESTLKDNLTGIVVWLLFLIIIPFIFSIFIENNLFKILQVGFILFTGTVNIFESYNSVYGPGMFFAAWLLIRHYGFFDNHYKLKYSIFLFFLVALTQISAFIHNKGVWAAGSAILIYTVFMIMIVIIIWRDIIKEQSNLRLENKILKINYKQIKDQLNNLEKDHIPYDLKSVKISPAEERVIKTLTIYKASNREIAERLNIAESTVKLHLYNI